MLLGQDPNLVVATLPRGSNGRCDTASQLPVLIMPLTRVTRKACPITGRCTFGRIARSLCLSSHRLHCE